MNNNIYIENYSEKSFVLRGDTQDLKEEIKKLGGKWSIGFTCKKNGEKFAAWLFFINKKPEIEKWLNDLKKSDNKSELKKSDNKSEDILNRLLKIENSINDIYIRLEKIENQKSIKKSCDDNQKSCDDNQKYCDDFDDDICITNYKHKRLI
jgi:hypothetical protein